MPLAAVYSIQDFEEPMLVHIDGVKPLLDTAEVQLEPIDRLFMQAGII
jgi:hypothetical protein